MKSLVPTLGTDGLVWVVDPLDGTTNFLHDFPSYAVSVAAAVDGVLEAGVVIHVPRNEIFLASRGSGAWQGERRLTVSTISDPAFSLIGTGFPFKDTGRLQEYLDQFSRIAARTSGIRRPGSAALDLADVAAGRFDGFWEQYLSAWDIAAGILLVREAGGLATDFAGRDLGIEHAELVAGNPAIHAWLLECSARVGLAGSSTPPRRPDPSGGPQPGDEDITVSRNGDSLERWTTALAFPSATPAGGAAAAVSAAPRRWSRWWRE